MKSSLLLRRISARLGLTALSLAALAGCAPLTPNLDAQFGDSVNLLKAQQVIDARVRRHPGGAAGRGCRA
jgi:hypothetical protein